MVWESVLKVVSIVVRESKLNILWWKLLENFKKMLVMIFSMIVNVS